MKAIEVKINFIWDGDTINCSDLKGNKFNSRCRWIDTPETQKQYISTDKETLNHWTYGEKAKFTLTQILLPFFTQSIPITIFNYEEDKYGRTLSDWYLLNKRYQSNIQYQLVAVGLAQPFLPFNRYDFDSRELTLYKAIFDGAVKSYRQNLGFWADYKTGNFILPYDFKKSFNEKLDSKIIANGQKRVQI